MIRTSTTYTPRHRADVATITAPANPWRYVSTHRANVTPLPGTVADERAAHRAAARMSRATVAGVA